MKVIVCVTAERGRFVELLTFSRASRRSSFVSWRFLFASLSQTNHFSLNHNSPLRSTNVQRL